MNSTRKILRGRLVIALLMVLGLFTQGPARADAANPSPTAVLEEVSQRMFEVLRAERKRLQEEPGFVYQVVDENLVPHVDFARASHWVLGRQHWRNATPEQRGRFVQEFRTLLVRFYSRALVEYLRSNEIPDNVITFLPSRVGPDDRDVTVRSEVRPPNGPVIPVHYQVARTKDGWKVYDVSVEGISMITSYRSSFAAEIRERGLDGLIESLAERNRELLSDQG